MWRHLCEVWFWFHSKHNVWCINDGWNNIRQKGDLKTTVCKFFLPWNISFKIFLRRWFLFPALLHKRLGVCTFGNRVRNTAKRADCFMAATNACVQLLTVITTANFTLLTVGGFKVTKTRLDPKSKFIWNQSFTGPRPSSLRMVVDHVIEFSTVCPSSVPLC